MDADYTVTTETLGKTLREVMLEALNQADTWHYRQATSRMCKKKKLMHRKYQQAIWWAIQNLEIEN